MDLNHLVTVVEKLYVSYGYLIIFLSSFIEISPMGWTIPGGGLVAIGGFFAYGGQMSLVGVILSAWLGAWICFIAAYLLGLKTGDRIVKFLKQENNAARASILLKNHGGMILTTSMLGNLTRFWVAYVAGDTKYGFKRFLFYSSVASLTWTSLMSVLGYLAGSERHNLENIVTQLGLLSWVFVIAAGFIIYLAYKQQFNAELAKKRH